MSVFDSISQEVCIDTTYNTLHSLFLTGTCKWKAACHKNILGFGPALLYIIPLPGQALLVFSYYVVSHDLFCENETQSMDG